MMKINFYGVDGSHTGEREYGVPLFEGDRGVQNLKEVILAYQANLRQGNACTKTRGDVKGSGKKLFRQKGTGMARRGERRSPLARGGGVVFGPKPRDFSVSVNKKERRLALKRAFFDAVVEQKVAVLEALKEVEKPRTKEFAQVLYKIVSQERCLLVDSDFSENQLLSVRNLKNVFSIDADSMNALDVVRYSRIVITERALNTFLKRLQA